MAKIIAALSLLSLAALAVASPNNCGPGWISYSDSCYYVETFKDYTYADAKGICERTGATLVVIDDEYEMMFLNAFNRGKYNLWIGLNDLHHENKFEWETGRESKYRNWAPGQPSNYKMKQHCVQIINSPVGKWKDVECSRKMGYICEKREEQCTPVPVGVESGAIPNSQITASSNFASSHMSHQGRLNWCQSGYSCSWCAKTSAVGQWLQIDLGLPRKVVEVATQGRSDYQQWVKSYKLSYGDGSGLKYVTDGNGNSQTFSGNTDQNTVVYHVLNAEQVFTARYVRFVVQSWQSHISMRVEVYACA